MSIVKQPAKISVPIPMYTAAGEEHGLTKRLQNAVSKEEAFKALPLEKREEREKLSKERGKLVRARFIHKKENNGKLYKPYVNGEGEPIECWHFLHDYVYDVPKGLCEEVNSYSMPKRAKEEVDGKVTRDERPEQIYMFVNEAGW